MGPLERIDRCSRSQLGLLDIIVIVVDLTCLLRGVSVDALYALLSIMGKLKGSLSFISRSYLPITLRCPDEPSAGCEVTRRMRNPCSSELLFGSVFDPG